MNVSSKSFQGMIIHPISDRSTDYLYRISIKCLVVDKTGNVLVVKERGRTTWDLPGGGMDHGEDFKATIAREMKEEVNLKGDFDYQILHAEDPALLISHDFWQVRLIFEVKPVNMEFDTKIDSDEVAFMNPDTFQNSSSLVERKIHSYYEVAQKIKRPCI